MLVELEVAAGVLQRGEPVETLAVRKATGSAAGSWEFPGGKCEAHESLASCLRRELLEELGIDVQVGRYVGVSEYRNAGTLIRLHAFFITRWSGEITLTEHDASIWLPSDQLRSLRWSPADIPLLEQVGKSGASARGDYFS